MMILFPLSISLAIGFMALKLILRKIFADNFFLIIFLSAGLGLGISSVLTFFSFLIFNGFNPFGISWLHLIFFAMLCFPFLKSHKKPSFTLKKMTIVISVFFILIGFYVYRFAQSHPFGEWDAWALWNMKARYLTLSGPRWHDVFTKLHWHTQPDYPLFLPFLITWNWLWTPSDSHSSPLILSVIFTVGCGGILFSAIKQYAKEYLGLLAFFILFTLNYYLFLGTAQYADIVLAYYLLTCLFLMVATLRENKARVGFCLGLFLGFIPFIKNEGIAISILLLMITAGYLWLEKKWKPKMMYALLAGLCLTGWAAFIFKFFLAPVNRDILTTDITTPMPFFNFEGCYLILSALWQNFTMSSWQSIWLIAALGIIAAFKNLLFKETRALTAFFILYLGIVFWIYLTTVHFDLNWRLSRTLPRILFYLLPSLLFSIFYALDRRRE